MGGSVTRNPRDACSNRGLVLDPTPIGPTQMELVMKSAPKRVGSKVMPSKARPGAKDSPRSAKIRSVPKLSPGEEALLEGISATGNFTIREVLKRNS